MWTFVTGRAGCLGGKLARRLRGRGDEVAALARSRGKDASLVALACEVVEGDSGRMRVPDARARRELGYEPRGVAMGMADLAAAGA
jgi:nucleoside-diphosphate-sugar epimerase